MAAEERVVELIIDASGVEAGMRRAESAYDHLGERAAAATAKAQAAFDRQLQIFSTKMPQSIDRVSEAFDKLRGRTDPVLAAQLRLENEMTRSLNVINRAVLLGVTTQEQAAAELSRLRQMQVVQLDDVRLAHDAVAAAAKREAEEYRRLAMAGRDAQSQGRHQDQFNSILGVRDPSMMSGGARESASVFEEMARKTQEADIAAAALAARVEQLRQSFDPAYAAASRFDSELASLAEAERLGIQLSGGYEAALNGLILKHDAVAAAAHRQATEYAQLALAGRQGMSADQFQRQINTQLGVSDPAMTSGSARASASVFEEAAREADRLAQRVAALRAQIDPAGTAQAKLNNELAEYAVLAARAEISATELAQAQALARSRYDAVVGGGNRGVGDNDNNAGFRRQNLGYQAFDIGQGLTSGLPLGMIAAQQLPQVAQLYAGQGGMKTFLSDVGSLATGAVTAIGALPLAIGAVGAAALVYDRTVSSSAAVAEKALKKHEEALQRIKGLFDNAGAASEQYGRRVQGAIDFTARSDRTGLDEALAAQTGSAGLQLLNAVPPKSGAAFTNYYGPYVDSVNEFIAASRQGRGDVQKLNDEVLRIANSNSADVKYQKIAQRIIDVTKAATDTIGKIRELDNVVRETTTTYSRQDEAEAAQVYASSNRYEMRRLGRDREASLAGIGARSPQELANAARIRERAQPVNPREDADVRNYRIETAATVALAQAQQSLNDAREARDRNLGKMVADQQLEISLLGKTAGETAALRQEYELINQLKEQARQNGGIVDEGEVARIRQTAAEVGKLTDQLARMRLMQESQFEREQLFRSEREAGIAAQLKAAGRPVDLTGADAAFLRNTEILKDNKRAWEDIRDVGRDTIDELSSGMVNGFKDIESIVKGVADDVLGQFTTLAAANPLKNALYGDTLPTLDSVGGAGGIFKILLGGKNPAVEAAKQAVGSMTVTAASVIVNGGASAGLGSLLPANNNAAKDDPFGAVLRNVLPDAGVTKTGIPLSEITAGSGLTAKVNSQYADRFQGLLNDLKGAGYNVTSLGEGGYSYRNVAGTNNLSKHSFGEALDINPRQNPWSNNFQTDLPANVNDMARRNGLTWGGTWNKPDTMHFQVDKSADATALSLNRVAANANALTQGFGDLGTGLGQVGNALSQFPAAPQGGSGGGFGGWLTGLLRGPFVPNGAQATVAANGGLGLYANGGISNRPAIFGEAGPEAAVPLPDGRRIPVEMRMPRIVASESRARQTVNRQVNIINAPPGYYPEVEEEEDDDGNEKVNVTFSRMAANEAGRPGSPFNKKLKSMGARPQRVRR